MKGLFEIRELREEDIPNLLEFERELRRQEPDTYFWEPDETYERQLRESFSDPRFGTALSFIALKDGKIAGRIDASVITSRSDASCCSVYLDWICVLKSERHKGAAQALLSALRKECAALGASVIIALTAENGEAQSFYRGISGASMHDTGIWIDVQNGISP